MADRINCKNCIHFHEDDQRCHLNDNDFIQKECYFRLGRRTPKGKDIVIEELKKKQNQIAIEELEKIINCFEPYENEEKETFLESNNGMSFIEYLEGRIEELKGE